MKFAILRGQGLVNNVIFDRNSPANRDNCFEPYSKLRVRFSEFGYQLDTSDINSIHRPKFEIHQDVQFETLASINYLLLFETEFVKATNGHRAEWEKYRLIFTWDDRLVDGKRFIKINYPNPIRIYPPDGFLNRQKFCCLIAGNKTLEVSDQRDLYLERIKAIRWFEQHAPQDFDLYGVGWDIPTVGNGLYGKMVRRFWRFINSFVKLKPFPSYRGRVGKKSDVLTRTRFAICYENVSDLPGYITEKIFDCFFSGCIPVYWGAANIATHIPSGCYIDRRNFRDTSEVYGFLKKMTEVEFKGYQQRIAEYLRSKEAHPFGSDFFSQTIVNSIVKDLGTQA